MQTDLLFFFFFQAEDGIRDYKVTGVQTCALPILALCPEMPPPTPRNGCRLPPYLGRSSASAQRPARVTRSVRNREWASITPVCFDRYSPNADPPAYSSS